MQSPKTHIYMCPFLLGGCVPCACSSWWGGGEVEGKLLATGSGAAFFKPFEAEAPFPAPQKVRPQRHGVRHGGVLLPDRGEEWQGRRKGVLYLLKPL